MRGIAIVLGLLFAVPSQAGVSCAELNRMWAKKYHKDFDADWKLKSFRCPSEVSKIAEAFYELDHLQLKSAPGTLAPDFYEWVKSIVRETRYRETSEDHPTAVAFAGGGKMTLLESYTRQDLEWRVGVLVHEARHNQKDDPRHVACAQGVHKGAKQGCDAEFMGGTFPNSGSGFNHDFAFHWWVRDASVRTRLDKSVSDAHMRNLLLGRFNKVSPADVQRFVFKKPARGGK
jgi:hypothetical protein